jgi:hypothetical protein
MGIAVGTPSPGGEEESDADTVYPNYVPSHPYAQGGLSFSTGGEARRQHADFAGAHPSVVHPPGTASGNPPISEIIARHKLPPHMAALQMTPHPYAQAPRDSYIEANCLIGQHRSDGTPHAAKMWAQLSPGVVREILAGDLVYSPYLEDNEENKDSGGDAMEVRDYDDGDLKENWALNIRDAVKVGETPLQFGEAGDSPLPEFARVRSRKRNAVHLVPSQSVDLGKSQRQNLEQTLDLDIEYIPNATQKQLEEEKGHQQSKSSSTDARSPNSFPLRSPPVLGSPHDLEGFQDLFYRPNVSSMQRTPHEAALPESPLPPHNISYSLRGSDISWDLNLRNRGTGSNLSSLARKLSEEFEQMALERERDGTSSQYSMSQYSNSHSYENHRRSQSANASSASRHQSGLTGVFDGAGGGTLVRRPTLEGGSLQFVFEEVIPLSESQPNDNQVLEMGMGLAAPIHAFSPSSDTLPEDVRASGASSFMENNEDDDPTGTFFHCL